MVAALAACSLLVAPAVTPAAKPGKASTGPTCNLPESDAEALVILSNSDAAHGERRRARGT